MVDLETTDWVIIVAFASAISLCIGMVLMALLAKSLMRTALNGALALTEAVMEDE